MAADAQIAVKQALKDGRLVRPLNCEQCGREHRRIMGHHYLGYAQEHELDVQWLCPSCHTKAHWRILESQYSWARELAKKRAAKQARKAVERARQQEAKP